MLIFDQLKKGDGPLRALAFAVLAGFGVLLSGLWYVQVFSARKYQQSLETQSYRTVRVPALRGRILDRNRQPLAENQPRFRLDLYLDELRPQFEAEFTRQRTNRLAELRRLAGYKEPGFFSRIAGRLFSRSGPRVGISKEEREKLARTSRFRVVSNIVEQTGRLLGQPLVLSEQALYLHHRDRLALPMALVSNATPAQLARFSERAWSLPAVNLEMQPLRRYPHGRTAAHLIGHLTRNDQFNDEEAAYNYRLPDFRGMLGLEHMFDHELRGVAGARSILVNSAGYRQRQGETEVLPTQPGQDLVLTIDLGIQTAAEKALASVSAEPRGAVVVMDPRNGDVLALASTPAFDPNEFVPAITHSNWARLSDERLLPMLNRATYGAYNPGSTFKIVTGLALLEAGLNPRGITTVAPDPANREKGAIFIGTRKIRDTAPPGDYDFRRAFIKSSNSYFIEHGLALREGMKHVLEMGHRFHLGETTGLKISQEVPGEFPELSDVENRWGPGNLANVCIGQEITVTPIQMAVLISAVANGGRVYWPRLVDRLESVEFGIHEAPVSVRAGQLRSQLSVRPEHLDVVRAAMRDDVADDGTGTGARIPGFSVCGKTGTAEVKQGSRLIDKITWFVSFAPYESPRYVVIVMVESGGSGGTTCAPVARRIYEYLHRRELAPKTSVARN